MLRLCRKLKTALATARIWSLGPSRAGRSISIQHVLWTFRLQRYDADCGRHDYEGDLGEHGGDDYVNGDLVVDGELTTKAVKIKSDGAAGYDYTTI